MYVHVWPRADQHGVDAVGREQLLPVRVCARDVELLRGSSARLERAIRDGDDLDSRHPAQPRNVRRADDAARADDPDADGIARARAATAAFLRERCLRRERRCDGRSPPPTAALGA